MEPSVSPLAVELTADLREALGPDLVGLYLFGSAVAGGFDEGASDLDLVAVTASPADHLPLRALGVVHAGFIERHAEWTDRLEIVYIEAEALRSFHHPGPLAVISPGEPFHLRHDAQYWLANWYLVRETGVVLCGEPPRDVFPAISRAQFLAGIRRYLHELRARDFRAATPRDRGYAVLTACRAWRTHETREPCSKQDAAAWAIERLPEQAPLIRAALECRLSRGRVGFDGIEAASQTATFLEDVARRMRPA